LLSPSPDPTPSDPGSDPGISAELTENLTGSERAERPERARDGLPKTVQRRDYFGEHFAAPPQEDPEVLWVWSRYCDVLSKPNARLDDVRSLTIRDLLQSGATRDDVEAVLLEVSKDDWYQAETHRQTVSFIFGNRERYEALVEAGRARLERRHRAAQLRSAAPEDDPDEGELVPITDEARAAFSGLAEAWRV